MRFKKSLWDDTEPDYAPGKIIKHGTYYWRPPKKYLEAGYSIKSLKLGGEPGDGLDYARAFQCRALTREMVRWHDGQTQGRTPGTWGWLIGRYLHDEYSDIQGVRPATREKYQKELHRIEEAIANVTLAETDYARLMEWRLTMERKGRSASYIKKWFTHWGLALSHGVKLGDDDCSRIQQIRSRMRLPNAAARSAFATRGQVDAIVAHIDSRGHLWASLAILLRFEFSLRGTDVYGQWEPDDGKGGGITYTVPGASQRRVWRDGITWDMVDPDLTVLRKVISKTLKSNPEPYAFPIDQVPEIRRRLSEIPTSQRVGPVIKTESGLPPRNDRTTKLFKAAVRDLGLPDDLQLRDTRAGGLTEGSEYDNPWALQHAGQHRDIATTNRYVRDRERGVREVIEFRQKKIP